MIVVGRAVIDTWTWGYNMDMPYNFPFFKKSSLLNNPGIYGLKNLLLGIFESDYFVYEYTLLLVYI